MKRTVTDYNSLPSEFKAAYNAWRSSDPGPMGFSFPMAFMAGVEAVEEMQSSRSDLVSMDEHSALRRERDKLENQVMLLLETASRYRIERDNGAVRANAAVNLRRAVRLYCDTAPTDVSTRPEFRVLLAALFECEDALG